MSALPVGQKSLTEAVSQWWRKWSRRSFARFELKCCGEEEVERMAKDIGVSPSELRRLANLGPDSADLLLRRMAALDLDRNEVSRTEPRTFQDLQRVCTSATITAGAEGTLRAMPTIRHGTIIAPTPQRSWRSTRFPGVHAASGNSNLYRKFCHQG